MYDSNNYDSLTKEDGDVGDPMTNQIDRLVGLVAIVVWIFNQCNFFFFNRSANVEAYSLAREGNFDLFVAS